MFLLILGREREKETEKREGGREKERKTSLGERNIDQLPSIPAPTRDQTSNLGM